MYPVYILDLREQHIMQEFLISVDSFSKMARRSFPPEYRSLRLYPRPRVPCITSYSTANETSFSSETMSLRGFESFVFAKISLSYRYCRVFLSLLHVRRVLRNRVYIDFS